MDDAALNALWAQDDTPEGPRTELIRVLLAQVAPHDAALAEVAELRLGGALEDPRLRGRLALVDRFCHEVCEQAGLPAALRDIVADLRPALAATALATPSWLVQPGHPVRATLRHWLDLCTGWEAELGRAAEPQARAWRTQLGTLHAQADPAAWERVALKLAAELEQRTRQRQRLDTRLHASERGQMLAARARTSAARQLNQRLGGRHLPAAAATLLSDIWFTALQQTWLRHGEDAPLWHELLQLAEALVWCLQPQARLDEHRARLYELAPELTDRLRRAADASSPGLLADALLADVEAALLAVLKNQELATVPAPLIRNQDPWSDHHTHLSRHLLDALDTVSPGDWFLATDPPQRRLRLVCRLDEARQLLFANWLGVRAETLSFERFAYLLNSRGLRPLPAGRSVDTLLAAAITTEQRMASARETRAQEQRHDARQRAEAAAREAARALVRAEPQAQAQLPVQAQAQAQVTGEQPPHEWERQRRQEQPARIGGDAVERGRLARRRISALHIGDALLLRTESGEARHLKLAVKLPSSGKLIFVDRDGRQRTELNGTDLAERLLAGNAELLEPRAAFDDTLARVVNGLRRERGLSRRNDDD